MYNFAEILFAGENRQIVSNVLFCSVRVRCNQIQFAPDLINILVARSYQGPLLAESSGDNLSVVDLRRFEF